MQYICDAPPYTWFRLETDGEATQESKLMEHAVERHFRQAHALATKSYVPPTTLRTFEQKIGLKDHVKRSMPLFLTLRDNTGKALVTAMLPPGGRADRTFRCIVVGRNNTDPYPAYGAAIEALGKHYNLTLDPVRCFPYRR